MEWKIFRHTLSFWERFDVFGDQNQRGAAPYGRQPRFFRTKWNCEYLAARKFRRLNICRNKRDIGKLSGNFVNGTSCFIWKKMLVWNIFTCCCSFRSILAYLRLWDSWKEKNVPWRIIVQFKTWILERAFWVQWLSYMNTAGWNKDVIKTGIQNWWR